MNTQAQPQNITVTSPGPKTRKPRAGKLVKEPVTVLDKPPVPVVTMTPSVPVITIDSGIPVPARTRRSLYPWKELAPGQSFFVPGKKVKSLASGAAVHGQKLGVKFSVKGWTIEQNGIKTEGARVWRIQ